MCRRVGLSPYQLRFRNGVDGRAGGNGTCVAMGKYRMRVLNVKLLSPNTLQMVYENARA